MRVVLTTGPSASGGHPDGPQKDRGFGEAPGHSTGFATEQKDNEKVPVLLHTGWEGWTQGSGDGVSPPTAGAHIQWGRCTEVTG